MLDLIFSIPWTKKLSLGKMSIMCPGESTQQADGRAEVLTQISAIMMLSVLFFSHPVSNEQALSFSLHTDSSNVSDVAAESKTVHHHLPPHLP